MHHDNPSPTLLKRKFLGKQKKNVLMSSYLADFILCDFLNATMHIALTEREGAILLILKRFNKKPNTIHNSKEKKGLKNDTVCTVQHRMADWLTTL